MKRIPSRRRTFTVQAKLLVLAETDGAADLGEIGVYWNRAWGEM
jgi:hypothetical protein